MADTVEAAIYRLQYQAGDSTAQLKSARTAAADLVAANENLSVSEEKVEKATRRKGDAMAQELAKNDQVIRAALRYQQSQQNINRLQQEGIGTTQAHALALRLAKDNYDKVVAANENATGALGRFGGALGSVKSVLASLGLVASIATVANFAREVFKSTADLDDQARNLGTTTDALQAYRAASVSAGASASIADEVLRKYTTSVGEAFAGNTKLKEAFKAIHVTAQELSAPDSGLSKTIRGIAELQNVADRFAIEKTIFGRSGSQLENVMDAWSEDIDKLIVKYKALGLIIDEQTIKRYDAAAARFELAYMRLTTIAATVVLPDVVAPINQPFGGFPGPAREAAKKITARFGSADIGPLSGLDMGPNMGTLEQAIAAPREFEDKVTAPTARDLAAYDDYLKKLKEINQALADTANKREIDAALIEAANAQQQQVSEKQRVHIVTVAQAWGVLSEAQAEEVTKVVADTQAKRADAEVLDIVAKKQAEATAAVEKFNEASAKTAEQHIDQRVKADIDAAGTKSVKEIKQGVDWSEIEDSLKEDLRLVGMTTKQREEEYAVTQARQKLGGVINAQEEERVRILIQQRQAAEEIQQVQEEMNHALASWLTNIVRTGKISWSSLFESMADIFSKQLERMLEEWLATQATMKSTSVGGGGGFLGSLVSAGLSLFGGGAGAATVGSDFGGAGFATYAASGADARPGESFMVGEEGPELFTPKVAGTIHPHGALGNTYINIDARGATPGMERKLLDAAVVIANQVVTARAPSIVAASTRSVSTTRKNMGKV